MFQNLPNILGNQRHVHIGAIWITEQEPWKVNRLGVKNAHYFTFCRCISKMWGGISNQHYAEFSCVWCISVKVPGRGNFGRATIQSNCLIWWQSICGIGILFPIHYLRKWRGGDHHLSDSREDISFLELRFKNIIVWQYIIYMHRLQPGQLPGRSS